MQLSQKKIKKLDPNQIRSQGPMESDLLLSLVLFHCAAFVCKFPLTFAHSININISSPQSFPRFFHCLSSTVLKEEQNSLEASWKPQRGGFLRRKSLALKSAAKFQSNGVLVALARSSIRFRYLQVPPHTHSSQGSFHRR